MTKFIARWNAEWLLASLQPKHPHPVVRQELIRVSAAVGRYPVPSLRPYSHTTLKAVIYLTHVRVCVYVCSSCLPSPRNASASLALSLGQTHMHVARDRLRTGSFDEQGLNIYLAFQRQRAERGRGCESVCLTNSGGSHLSAGPGELQDRNVKEFFTSLFCVFILFSFCECIFSSGEKCLIDGHRN